MAAAKVVSRARTVPVEIPGGATREFLEFDGKRGRDDAIAPETRTLDFRDHPSL
jgi:hypothetical protein